MIVLIDIGNTRTKYQVISPTCSKVIKFVNNSLLTFDWLSESFGAATEIIVANVNELDYTETIKTWAESQTVSFTHIEVSSSAFGVTCGYEEPEQLGVDRWLVTLAAAKLYPNSDVVIVDSGTATTIDVLLGGTQYQGGLILPGIEMMRNSLFSATKRIQKGHDFLPSMAIGTNTSEAVNGGAWASTIGAIETCINEYSFQELIPKVLLTGGNGKPLASYIAEENVFIEDLVFQGMLRFSKTFKG